MVTERSSSTTTPMTSEDSGKGDGKNDQGREHGASVDFFTELLTAQCRYGQVAQGAVFLPNGDQHFSVLATHPSGQDAQKAGDWLGYCADAGKRALMSNTPLVVPVRGDGQGHVIALPLDMQRHGRVIETFLVRTANQATIESTARLLQLTAGLVCLTYRHLLADGGDDNLKKLRQAMETLSAANRHHRFTSVAMAVCNELATQCKCERVSLGFLKGRYVRVKAISHTEQFGRKMRLIQDIEAAMEECLDQDCEIVFPNSPDSTCVTRAAEEFSSQHNQAAILSLPLRHEGRPQGVITLERLAERPFTAEETETIRLTCDLCTPRLMNLHHYDRWFGARAVTSIRQTLAKVLGAEHTWVKMATVLVFGLIVFAFFAKGWYRVKAPFMLEAISEHKITAPFDGYIKDVAIEVGDQVIEGQTPLAELDTIELRLQLVSKRAERVAYLKEADAAMRDNEIAQAQIAQANAEKAQALIDLYSYRIERAKILSPLTGTLVIGDLKRQIGAPVNIGQILFEIAPLDSLRAELYVPEDEISEVEVGQEGNLATASFPGQHLPFIVERVNPAAEVVNNRNVFKVRVRLLETRMWMRPGMEGVAKITIEKRRYAEIWSRKVVNWIRMKLWI